MNLKDQLMAAAQQHQGTELGTLLQEAATELDRLREHADVAAKNCNQAISRMTTLAMSRQELSSEMSTLLVLHLERDPIGVYQKLDVLAARYVRSVSAKSLQAMAATAGKVH